MSVFRTISVDSCHLLCWSFHIVRLCRWPVLCASACGGFTGWLSPARQGLLGSDWEVMALLRPGRRVYVSYVGFEEETHERVVLAHVQANIYMVATPDWDVFAEQLDSTNIDLASVRIGPEGGGLPVGLLPAAVYGFTALGDADLRSLIEEGAQGAAFEKQARGLGAPPGAAGVLVHAGALAAPVAGGAVAPVAHAAPVVGGGGAGAAAGLALAAALPGPLPMPVGGGWVLDEPTEGHDVGDQFSLPGGAMVLGDRCLVQVGGDVVTLKHLPGGTDIRHYARERQALLADDERVLPVADGPRSFGDAVADMSRGGRSVGPPSPLDGPATAEWWLEAAAREHRSLVTRSQRWRAESGVSKGSAIAYEHEVESRALELGATIDGINLKKSVMCEFLLRRLQLAEAAVLENPDQPSFEGARHFLGIPDRRGGALVAPSLNAHVAAELGREAGILKEKRKAREARAPGPKGGGRGGAGGAGT